MQLEPVQCGTMTVGTYLGALDELAQENIVKFLVTEPVDWTWLSQVAELDTMYELVDRAHPLCNAAGELLQREGTVYEDECGLFFKVDDVGVLVSDIAPKLRSIYLPWGELQGLEDNYDLEKFGEKAQALRILGIEKCEPSTPEGIVLYQKVFTILGGRLQTLRVHDWVPSIASSSLLATHCRLKELELGNLTRRPCCTSRVWRTLGPTLRSLKIEYGGWRERVFNPLVCHAVISEVRQIAQFCTVLQVCCIAAPYSTSDAVASCMTARGEYLKYGRLCNPSPEQALRLKQSCPNVKVQLTSEFVPITSVLEILGDQVDSLALNSQAYEVTGNRFGTAIRELRSLTCARLNLAMPRDVEAFLSFPHAELRKLTLDDNIPVSLWANLTRHTGSLQVAVIDSDPISPSLLGPFLRANPNLMRFKLNIASHERVGIAELESYGLVLRKDAVASVNADATNRYLEQLIAQIPTTRELGMVDLTVEWKDKTEVPSFFDACVQFRNRRITIVVNEITYIPRQDDRELFQYDYPDGV